MKSPPVVAALLCGLLASASAASEFPADKIFAGSGGNDRVLAYGLGGKLVAGVGGATALQDPGSMAFGPDGQLWVASRSTGLVHSFNPSGSLSSTIGALAGLADPTALTFTPAGTLLIADGEADTLIEVGMDGVFLSLFGDGVALPSVRDLLFLPDGRLLVASADAQAILELDAAGNLLRTLGAGEGLTDPAAMAFGSDGRLFVSSGDADEIVVLDRDGDVDERITLPGALDRPGGLAFVSTGELVVVSRGTDEVLVLGLDGSLQQTIGSSFSDGWDVAVSPHRFKFVVKGTLVRDGVSSDKLKQTGALAVQPGGLQLMVALDPLEDESGLETFGSRFLVLPGYELQEDAGQKKRLYTGSWLRADAPTAGSGSLAVDIKGKVSKKTGEYTVKKAQGSLLRSSPAGVFIGSAKSGKALK